MDSFNPVGEVFKQIRYLVSRDKNRFVDDEANIDLDLTYITDRVIGINNSRTLLTFSSHGFPC